MAPDQEEIGYSATEDGPSGGGISGRMIIPILGGVVIIGAIIGEVVGFEYNNDVWVVGITAMFFLVVFLTVLLRLSGETEAARGFDLGADDIEYLTGQMETFATSRESYRAHLRENPRSLLRTAPHYTVGLLTSLAALETFFTIEEVTESTEEAFRTLDELTLVLMDQDAIRGQIILGFDELGLIDLSHESGSTTTTTISEGDQRKSISEEDEKVKDTEQGGVTEQGNGVYRYKKEAIIDFGVSPQDIPPERDLNTMKLDSLVSFYASVLSASGEKAVPLDEETISVFREADFTLHADAETHIYDAVKHSTFDWDNLSSFNEALRRVLDRATLPPFDEHVLSRLHYDIQRLLTDIHSPTFDEENVSLLPDIDYDSFVEANQLSLIDGAVLYGICEYENEPLPHVISALNDVDLLGLCRFSDTELSALSAFYSLRERYDRNELTRSQFDRELSQLLQRETVEGQKRYEYLREISSA